VKRIWNGETLRRRGKKIFYNNTLRLSASPFS
jgi:ribosome-associated protein YbcJ (S4-like RNA binding protein)